MQNSNQIQRDALLARLRKGPVTPKEALEELGIGRLAARVYELKKRGHNIQPRWVRVPLRDGRTARVARYYLMGVSHAQG